jgi:N-methylhydantoinase A
MTNLRRPPLRTLRIGVDTGGTFTDFIVFAGRQARSFKVPSTPAAPARAILDGVTQILNELSGGRQTRSRTPNIIPEIVHGTTVGTNALLERKGARTALVTTAGFEDVIEIGRQARPEIYNLAAEREDPLVSRHLRFGVGERVDAGGRVVRPLELSEINDLARKLRAGGVESVAISLLFSFANPAHERALAAALADLGLPLSVSHQLLPEYREYERTSTVVINAYLVPRVSGYLEELQAGLRDKVGVGTSIGAKDGKAASRESHRLRIMQSSGGSIAAGAAAREPVRTILSGPAGGVVAAARVAELAGIADVITFDMGGTSTDVALARGAVSTTREARVAGLPVAVPVLDIHTVGAGGGSVAAVDAGGALKVGPESAGADPGPACYGVGTRATVTDANVVLGRFGGGGLLGGRMKLDEKRAAQVIDELAARMSEFAARKVTRHEAALGVVRVANANMEGALRLVSIERGHDPRRFTLVSFGGAGGLHAVALAEALRIPRVLVPPYPGAFSALGVLLADVVKDYSQTVMLTLPAAGAASTRLRVERQLAARFAELRREATQDLKNEGFKRERVRLHHSLALRYLGQSFELEIPFDSEAGNAAARSLAVFHRAHRERYGHADEGRAVEVVSVRLKGVGVTDKPPLPRAESLTRKAARPHHRAAAWLGAKKQEIPIYERESLLPGMKFDGPALLTEYGSTTLVPALWRAAVDAWHSLIIQRRHPA